MKKTAGIFLSVLIAFILAGCGTENASETNAEESSNNSSHDDGDIQLEVWVQNSDTFIEPAAEDFMEQNPNVTIDVSTYTTDGIKEALSVAASSGTLPDIWFNWGGSLASFYPEQGLSLDLTDHAEANNWDDIYLDTALELSTLDGQLAGVPRTIRGLGFIYNKEIFDDLNIDVPETFTEFEEVLFTLAENDITPISTGGRYGWHTMRITEALIEHYAGPELRDEFMEFDASWENDAVVNAFEKLQEWEENGFFPTGFVSLDPTESKIELYRGTAAMQLEGSWFNSEMLSDGENLEDYGFFPFPNDNETQRVSGFVEMHQINNQSAPEVQEAAIAFAEFYTDPEVIANYPAEFGFPSARIEDPLPEEQIHVPEFIEALENGSFVISDQHLPQEIADRFFEVQDNVLLGSISPEEGASEMQESIERYEP